MTYFESHQHFYIQFRKTSGVINYAHNDVHNLGLYRCQEIVSRESARFLLFHCQLVRHI